MCLLLVLLIYYTANDHCRLSFPINYKGVRAHRYVVLNKKSAKLAASILACLHPPLSFSAFTQIIPSLTISTNTIAEQSSISDNNSSSAADKMVGQ